MWWGHGHDRRPETWDAKDALCALFGANPIFVGDPTHPLELETAKRDRFVQTVRAFDELRRRTFGLGMTSYEVLGRHVAVTEFEDGTQVRANVGPTDSDGLAAGSFQIVTRPALSYGRCLGDGLPVDALQRRDGQPGTVPGLRRRAPALWGGSSMFA